MTTVEKVKADRIEASYADGKLLIFAQGEMPDTFIQSIKIVRSMLDVEPPKFTIQRTFQAGHASGKQMTPWTHIDVFEIGVFRDVIKVEDSRGVHDVKVSWIVPLGEKRPGIKKTEGTGGEVPFPFFTIGDGLKDRIGIAESVGYSATMSFDEALQDAIKNLAPDGPGYPDELKSYTVTSVSAEFGGIAGVSRLRVAIRGSRGGL